MFDSIRKHQRLLQFVLLVLIFPAFAFFGIQGYEGFFSADGALAKVAGDKVTRPEYEAAHQRQAAQLRQMLGDRFDSSLLDNPEARMQILDSLISQRALMADARANRVSVTDDQVRHMVRSIPGLTLPDGSFDRERYRQSLAAQGQSEAAFEAQVKADLAMQAMPDAITQTTLVPQSLVDRLIAAGEQTREVRELAFRPADFTSKVTPTDEDLTRFYEAQAALFETPETARVEYLTLSSDALAKQIKVTAEDVQHYYEQNKSRYATREQRRASHILVNAAESASQADKDAARAKAEALLKQLRDGADFAALAKAQSQDPGSAADGGDLGFFTPDMMVKPFSDAAFALKKGEISDVVQSEFGFHIIQLTDLREGNVRPLEAVRGEIEEEIRKQLAGTRYAEAAETFSNLVYEQADSLKPAAERLSLTVETADGLSRNGSQALPPEHPLNDRKLLATLFSADSISSRRNTEAVDIGGGRLVSARLVDYQPVQRKPFEAVRDDVRQRFVLEEARKLAVQAGEARLKALQGGAAAEGFSSPRAVSRATSAEFPMSAVEAVFRAPTAKLPSLTGADLGAQGYSIYQIVKVNLPDEKKVAELRQPYLQQLRQAYSQQALLDYLESVKSRTKIVKYPERLAVSENR
ncbi:MAG: SurA N-terminal domain-containing protein [Burkholderiaceae bacterium]